eukprot:6177056-Pleurochrysis_carterae.AAC.4
MPHPPVAIPPFDPMGGGPKGPGPPGIRTPEDQSPEMNKIIEPISEEGLEGAPAMPEQAQEILAEIDAVLEASPSIALDGQAPFGCEKEGSGVPLASQSDVGRQGKSRVRVRSFTLSPIQSGLERRNSGKG